MQVESITTWYLTNGTKCEIIAVQIENTTEIDMTVVEGIVGVNMASKYGDLTDRRIKFEDNAFWYGAKANLESELKRGDRVKVRVEGEGNQAYIVKVKLLEAGAKPPQARRGGGGGGGGKSQLSKEEWAEKDRTIQYQHAQKQGIALAVGAVAAGVKIPVKGAEATFLTMVDRYTATIYTDIATKAAVARVDGEVVESDTVDAAPAADADDGFDDVEPGDPDGFDDDDGF